MAGAAAAARVLRPGGRLAVFWNAGQPSPAAAAAFAEITARLVPDLPAPPADALSAYTTMGGLVVTGMTDAGFAPPDRWRDDWQRDYTRDEWLDVLPTQGLYTRLPADQLTALLAATGQAIDDLGGGFTMHYSALTVTATNQLRPEPA
ncbi:hypothetical protein AB0J82_29280 [Asanoa sp. NPDC049518]|uniref:hypothetical protein n=1 Tax=unclassified Asanoa TaxID=2685164 RepID=UPI00341270B5